MKDIVIVGGGVAGLSAAAHLSALGSLTLLERETGLGYHASGRSAALFEETYGTPTTIALNRASRAYLDTAHGGVLSQRGLMLVGSTAHAEDFASDFVKMKMHQIGLSEAQAMVPILNGETVTHVGYHAETWDIDTDLLLQNYAREARRNDAEIITNAPVTAITNTQDGWRIESSSGTYFARVLVNASGAWADRIAVLAGIAPLGFQPMRRSVARIPAPGGHDVKNWPMIFGPGERWYAKPDAGKLIVSPADEEPVPPQDAWADDMVLAEGLARYEEMVTEPVTRVISNWAGLRTFSPDRSLVIGRAADNPEFFWIAGQGGYGMQSSPAAGALAADLISGRQPAIGADVATALSPLRFG